MADEPVTIRRLTPLDVGLMRELNTLFAAAFAEPETYQSNPPGEAYLAEKLGKDTIAVLVALVNGSVVGALVAYQLEKFESERSEFYIYDLAVAEEHRRKGIATALISRVREIAAERGAWVVFVQADYADAPAVALYRKLGVEEEVLHFDLPLEGKPG